jgi:serralysin
MNLLLSYETSALAAPQSFRDAMQAAANILDAAIFDNITVTIRVGYGDWNNNADTGITTGAEGGTLNGLSESYTALKAALASHETSTVDQTFVNSLPNTSSVNGVSHFYVPSAVDKALGLLPANGNTIDGAVGIGTQISSSLLVGVALHELTHAMGRVPGEGPFDLFRYTSPGVHLFSSGDTAPAAYFSIDGGNTKLADFGRTSDPSDFLNSGVQGPNDAFNEFYSNKTIQNLSAVDKELLDALGFNTTGTPGTVIEANGSTSLVEVGSKFFLYPVGGSSGPSLKDQGVDFVVFNAWTPIGAEQTASGYEVAWKYGTADQYTIWMTDSNGNFVSDTLGPVSGASIESYETSFHQDLNGDGVIGPIPAATFAVTPANQGRANSPVTYPVAVALGSGDNDTFVFKPGMGAEVIVNPTSAVTIELGGSSSVTDNNQLQTLLHDAQIGHVQSLFEVSNGHDTVINLGNHDNITLTNIQLADLHAGSLIIH